MSEKTAFRRKLEGLINGHAMESGSDTPDWILAEYLTDCLTAFDAAVTKRERWYGRAPQEADAAVSAELDGEPCFCSLTARRAVVIINTPSAHNFGDLRFEQLDFRITATIHTGDGAAIGLHETGENHYNQPG